MGGIILTPLKRIHNPKGDIFHAMKVSDGGYEGFGEAYFSSIKQTSIKGWKKHSTMTLNLIVAWGAIEFVVYDEDVDQFYSVELSETNYQRLTVKPGLWVAFRGIKKNNILLNIANIEHHPDEATRKDLEQISYEW